MSRTRFTLGGSCLVVLFSSPVVLHAASLRVSVSSFSVAVSAATPGGEVLLLGVADRTGRSAKRFYTYNIALSASPSGDVTWQAPAPIEPNSAWIAVDVESGKYAVAASGKELKDNTLSEQRIKRDKDGHWRRLEPRLPFAQIAVSRPKRGSWLVSAGDGGVRDKDGVVDGKIDLDVADIEAFGKTSGSLAKLEDGDLVLVLDPIGRVLFTRKLTGK